MSSLTAQQPAPSQQIHTANAAVDSIDAALDLGDLNGELELDVPLQLGHRLLVTGDLLYTVTATTGPALTPTSPQPDHGDLVTVSNTETARARLYMRCKADGTYDELVQAADGGGGGGGGLTQTDADGRYLRKSQNLADAADTAAAATELANARPNLVSAGIGTLWADGTPYTGFDGDGTTKTVTVTDSIDINGWAVCLLWEWPPESQPRVVWGWEIASWDSIVVDTVDGAYYRFYGMGSFD